MTETFVQSSNSPLPRRSSESGFTLAGLLIIMIVMTIMVAYTVPRQWSTITARERDQQTLFAMKQYARAIKAFQDKNHTVPVSLDQLKQARNPRFMRGSGELLDPLTGKVDWIPVSPAEVQQTPGAQTLPPGVAPPGATGTVNPANPGGLIVGYPGAPPLPPPPMPSPTPGTGLQGQQQQPGSPGGFSGPIAGVRPNKTGPSYLSVNGAETYEQWRYTIIDLENEINTRRNAVMVK